MAFETFTPEEHSAERVSLDDDDDDEEEPKKRPASTPSPKAADVRKFYDLLQRDKVLPKPEAKDNVRDKQAAKDEEEQTNIQETPEIAVVTTPESVVGHETDASAYHYTGEAVTLPLKEVTNVTHEIPLYPPTNSTPPTPERQPQEELKNRVSNESPPPPIIPRALKRPESHEESVNEEMTSSRVAAGGGGDWEGPPRGPEQPQEPDEPEPTPDPILAMAADRTSTPEWSTPSPYDQIPATPGVSPNSINQKQLERAMDDSERLGLRRGLWTGLLLGGFIEHWRHRHREKKLLKAHVEQTEKLSLEHQAQTYNQNYLQQQLNRRHEDTTRRLQNELAARPTMTEILAAQPSLPRSEAVTQKEEPKHPLPSLEQPVEEPVALPTDHRVETSAWHRIEIDAKTGKPVETPVLTYGREFRQEQNQEAVPKDTQVTIPKAAMPTLPLDLVSDDTSTTTPQDATPTYQPLRQPTAQRPIPPPSVVRNDLTNLWLWIVAIVLLFFVVAVVILR